MTSIPELPGEDAICPFDRGLIPGLTRGGKEGRGMILCNSKKRTTLERNLSLEEGPKKTKSLSILTA
jgi:hypothetical protein